MLSSFSCAVIMSERFTQNFQLIKVREIIYVVVLFLCSNHVGWLMSNLWLDLQGVFIVFGQSYQENKGLTFSIVSFNINLFHIFNKTKTETNEIQQNPDFPNCQFSVSSLFELLSYCGISKKIFRIFLNLIFQIPRFSELICNP